MAKADATVGSCCEDCWSYAYGQGGGATQCDVWVFDPRSGACALKASDLAAHSQIVAAARNSTTAYISGTPYSLFTMPQSHRQHRSAPVEGTCLSSDAAGPW